MLKFKKTIKSNWLKIIMVFLIIILLLFTIINLRSRKVEIDNINPDYSDKQAKEISSTCDNSTSNVGSTECEIIALDKISAIREWKQNKIENAKHPQINQYNLSVTLDGAQSKIKAWRENFENSRDATCEAKNSFLNGSGTPGSIASCKIDFEMSAIEDLNYIYYGTILEDKTSEGILNFEPSTAEINNLANSNKTKRGCIWAGDINCE